MKSVVPSTVCVSPAVVMTFGVVYWPREMAAVVSSAAMEMERICGAVVVNMDAD